MAGALDHTHLGEHGMKPGAHLVRLGRVIDSLRRAEDVSLLKISLIGLNSAPWLGRQISLMRYGCYVTVTLRDG